MDSANEWTETVLHLHIFHLLQTVSPTQHAPGCRSAGPRLARGGLPGSHLLGRAVHLPVRQLPASRGSRHVTRVPVRAARRGSGGGTGERASRVRCSRGRAAPTGGRRPSGCTSTRSQGAGCPTTRTCSAMSTSRSRTTSGSTTWSPAASTSCASPAPSCSSKSPGSGPASPPTTRAADRYEIHGVMGPDEYHDGYPDSDEAGLRNNTYTNVMAVWVLAASVGGVGGAAAALPPRVGRRAGDPRRGVGTVAATSAGR